MKHVDSGPWISRTRRSCWRPNRPNIQTLNDLIGEASGKGVLRALHRKYSPAAFEAIIQPILQEIGEQAPVRPRPAPGRADDPLTAPTWPPG